MAFLSAVIREIINTDGVSSQLSFVRFVRFVFFQNQRAFTSLVGLRSAFFLEHESHESTECRYVKRPWRLESPECISYETLTVFLSVVIREIINTGGVSSQLSFVRFVRFVFFKK